MTTFNWKIKQTLSSGNELISVHYLLTASDETHEVQSEGHADVKGKIDVPYEDIRESTIFDCLARMYLQDEPNSLKCRLQEQLDYLKNEMSTEVPWKAQIFTVKL